MTLGWLSRGFSVPISITMDLELQALDAIQEAASNVQKRNFVITVSWLDGSNFVGTFGRGKSMYSPKVTGDNISDILRKIADWLDTHPNDQFASQEHLAKSRHRKPCKYCKAPIFFVKNTNQNWIAVDGAMLQKSEITEFDEDGKSRLMIRAFLLADRYGEIMAVTDGTIRDQCWINHAEVCGSRSRRPNAPVLVERWERNHDHMLEKRDDVTENFASILKDLND